MTFRWATRAMVLKRRFRSVRKSCSVSRSMKWRIMGGGEDARLEPRGPFETARCNLALPIQSKRSN